MTLSKMKIVKLCGVIYISLLLGFVAVSWFGQKSCPLRSYVSSNQFPAPTLRVQLGTLGVANAIPVFARKHNMKCTACHTGFPYLNKTGRDYLEAGFRFGLGNTSKDKNIGKGLSFEPFYPLSARLKSELFQKTKDNPTKMKAMHEIELSSMGVFSEKGSFYFELEGEEEDMFSPSFNGRLGFHLSPYFNVIAGFGQVFAIDPYNSLAEGGRRITVSHKAPLNTAYLANFAVRRNAQFLNIYGRANKFYYSVGYTAGPKNNYFGTTPQIGYGRAAFDLTDQFSLGALFVVGKKNDTYSSTSAINATGTKRDVTKYGADVNFDMNNLHFDGLFLSSKDKTTGGSSSETNLSAFGELFYTYMANERPLFTPLMRIEWVEQQGVGSKTTFIGNVQSYVWQNCRGGVEFSADLSVPTGTTKSWTGTLFADLMF